MTRYSGHSLSCLVVFVQNMTKQCPLFRVLSLSEKEVLIVLSSGMSWCDLLTWSLPSFPVWLLALLETVCFPPFLMHGRPGSQKDTELGGRQGMKNEKRTAMTRDMTREAESEQRVLMKDTLQERS